MAAPPPRPVPEPAERSPTHIEVLLLYGVRNLRLDASMTALRAHLRDVGGRDHPIGSIQAALRRMERQGWLSSRPGASRPMKGGRRPILYAETALGRSAREIYTAELDALRAGTEYERGRISAPRAIEECPAP